MMKLRSSIAVGLLFLPTFVWSLGSADLSLSTQDLFAEYDLVKPFSEDKNSLHFVFGGSMRDSALSSLSTGAHFLGTRDHEGRFLLGLGSRAYVYLADTKAIYSIGFGAFARYLLLFDSEWLAGTAVSGHFYYAPTILSTNKGLLDIGFKLEYPVTDVAYLYVGYRKLHAINSVKSAIQGLRLGLRLNL